MPVVDDNGNEIDVRVPWCLQTAPQQRQTSDLVEIYRGDIEDEIGEFKWENLPSGRVLLTPKESDPLVAYLSDPGQIDTRLMYDDFTPEIWPEWWPEAPLPGKMLPKKLGA